MIKVGIIIQDLLEMCAVDAETCSCSVLVYISCIFLTVAVAKSKTEYKKIKDKMVRKKK